MFQKELKSVSNIAEERGFKKGFKRSKVQIIYRCFYCGGEKGKL